ncbi:MAG: hypothetical protein RR240_06120 [Burkholderiaceae bacterium]
MPSCVLLLPGALLPARIAPDVLRAAALPVLGALLNGAQAPISNPLVATEAMAGAAHLAWLWQVFAHRSDLPVTAPYAWAALGGPALSTEVWRVRPCHFALARDHMLLDALADDAPSAAEIDARSAALRVAARDAGFMLQQFDHHWFLTRKTPWPVQARPWESQLGATIGPESVAGESQLEWRKLLNDVQMSWHVAGLNDEREAADRRPINGVWIDGGGRHQRLSPSNFHAVLADDEAIRGWALATGMQSTWVRPLQDHWPDSPRGDILAVLPDLLAAHRNEDWGDWLAALPALEARIERLIEAARGRGIDTVVLAATGRETARTVIKTDPGWRFWRRWQAPSLADWLAEPTDLSEPT